MNHDLIPNSRFRFMNKPGTGNKTTKVSDSEKLRLTNIIIERAEVDAFLKALYDRGEDKIKVELSPRRTSKRWGSAWTLERRVALYRHTVWVFLHEIAHILDVHIEQPSGRIVSSNKPHGRDFGYHLKKMYELWMVTLDTGKKNLPVKADQPNLKNDFNFEPRINQFKVPERRRRVVGGIALQVGDKVWFRYKGIKQYGKVFKVNRVNCKVRTEDGRGWRVSPKLLNKD